MGDVQYASVRDLIAELATVEDRLRELAATADCPEGRSWTAAELERLGRREDEIRRALEGWRVTVSGML